MAKDVAKLIQDFSEEVKTELKCLNEALEPRFRFELRTVKTNIDEMKASMNFMSLITEDYEILSIKKDKHVFAVLCRPPNGNIHSFFEFFECFLFCANNSGYTLTTGGDFTIDLTT